MSVKKPERRGLGRGLSALMADVQSAPSDPDTASRRRDLQVPIENVFANPNQPRRTFEPEALDELRASIAEKGIIQPLIVRRQPGNAEHFEIVAGERRWRAAQLAQLHEVPVIIREFSDTEVLEVAIIENIQRADLNPLEEAMGYRQLMEKFGHTQEKMAEALSKSRSHIANLLRLLTLPEEVQAFLREGKLTAGHARALVTASDPVRLAKEVIAKGLSVREVEHLAKTAATGAAETGPRKAQARGAEKDADTRALEADLAATIGMAVSIDHAGQEGGRLTVSYRSLDDLDKLCQALSKFQ